MSRNLVAIFFQKRNILILSLLFITSLTVYSASFFPIEASVSVSNTLTGSNKILSADIDLDGDTDIFVVATYTDSQKNIYWLENIDGNTNNMIQHQIASNLTAYCDAAVAFIDSDNKPDLVVALTSEGSIVWYKNNYSSASNWVKTIIAETDRYIWNIAVDDIDNDGKTDVTVSLNSGGTLKWYKNVNGEGTSWQIGIIADIGSEFNYSIQIADINRDGEKDIITGSNSINWYEKKGNTFTKHLVKTNTGSYGRLRIADMDGDGNPDIIGLLEAEKFLWYKNDGNGGTWTETNIATESNSNGFFTIDYDFDGDLDIFAITLGYKYLYLENSNGSGTVWNKTTKSHTTQIYSFSLCDYDEDEDQDVFFAYASTNGSNVAFAKNITNHRNAVYPTRTTLSEAITSPRVFACHDIDDDGYKDILSVSNSDNTIQWLRSDSAKSLPAYSPLIVTNDLNGSVTPVLSDLNNDGKTDIACAIKEQNKIAWAQNGASAPWTLRNINTTAYNTTSVAAGDFDNDGDNDVAYAAAYNSSTSNYYVYLAINDGDPANVSGTDWVSDNINGTPYQGPVIIKAGDVNNDRRLDIVSAYQGIGKIFFHQNISNPPAFMNYTVESGESSLKYIELTDIDKDSDLDILAVASDSSVSETFGKLILYKNNGSSSWVKTIIDSSVILANFVAAADVDHDGDNDIIVNYHNITKNSAAGIFCFINDGNGETFTKKDVIRTVLLANYPPTYYGFAIDDFDKNGSMDIVSSSSDNKIILNENKGGQYSLTTTSVAPGTVDPANTAALFRLAVVHNGWQTDSNIEPAGVRLFFSDSGGTGLSQNSFDSLIEAVSLYLDDGSNTFDKNADTYIGRITDITLSNGYTILNIPSTNPLIQVQYNTPKTFFMAVDTTPEAALAANKVFKAEFIVDMPPVILPWFVSSSGRAALQGTNTTGAATGTISITNLVTEELILDYLIGRTTVTPGEASAFDINSDSKVDISDAVRRINQ